MTPAYGLWAVVAITKLVIFALAGRSYGYLSDELYFLDAARHLAAGYVDFPPAIAWVTAGLTGLLGTDLLVLRGFACLVGIAVSIVAVDTVRLLGGGRLAQWLAAPVITLAPAFLSVQSLFTMNVLDQLCWAGGFWLLARYLRDHRPRDMLALGATYGAALLTKLAIPAWFLGLGIATLIRQRELLARGVVWAALLLMLVVASPFLYWQIANHWPFLEFVRAYNASAPEAMVIDQPLFGLITTMNPPFILIWLPGLVYGLIARDATVRLLGTAAVIALTVFLAAGVKFYFATPLFILFTAFGALLWERWLADRRRARAALLATLILSGLSAVPIAAPVLPGNLLQRLADFIRDGEQGAPGTDPAPLGRYFPHFAEMHGWPELTVAVTREYESLPDQPTLFAAFFGQAAALNQLDPADRLPEAYSGHMNYYLWSADAELANVLFVGFEPELLATLYRDVTVLERFQCERCMARENGLYLVHAQEPLVPQAEIRSRLKRYYFF